MSQDWISRVCQDLGDEAHLNTKQVAYLLGISCRHLRRMRSRGDGPPVRSYSRRLSYRLDEVRQWADARRASPSDA